MRSTEETVASKVANKKPRQKKSQAMRIRELKSLAAALGSPVVVKRQGTKGTISISFLGLKI